MSTAIPDTLPNSQETRHKYTEWLTGEPGLMRCRGPLCHFFYFFFLHSVWVICWLKQKFENTYEQKEKHKNTHDPTTHTLWIPFQMLLCIYLKAVYFWRNGSYQNTNLLRSTSQHLLATPAQWRHHSYVTVRGYIILHHVLTTWVLEPVESERS